MKDYFSDKQVLQELLNDSMFLKHTQSNTVTLTEEQAEDSEIVITNLPNDIIIIKSDEFRCTRRPSNREISEFKNLKGTEEGQKKSDIANRVFKGNYGENDCADYVLLSPSLKVILFLELKSTKDTKSGAHIINQLKGAQCFVECCKIYATHFIEKARPDFLNDYHQRFIKCLNTNKKYVALDTERRPRTTCTQKKEKLVPDSPDKAQTIRQRNVSFRHIAWIKNS